ncbi:hypothetical protein C5167_023617 [Papaver somniferum]|uniref:Uncharacterized protein n=1 Tax=Papaver somniferum TaxID=3469 RepID=A0A4Y7JM92_PAPSO|nr:hypothetical protein C5167_023617 [Papaver somniferum]
MEILVDDKKWLINQNLITYWKCGSDTVLCIQTRHAGESLHSILIFPLKTEVGILRELLNAIMIHFSISCHFRPPIMIHENMSSLVV